jgi:hypothetical protein
MQLVKEQLYLVPDAVIRVLKQHADVDDFSLQF